jgi:hypothetical protein
LSGVVKFDLNVEVIFCLEIKLVGLVAVGINVSLIVSVWIVVEIIFVLEVFVLLGFDTLLGF